MNPADLIGIVWTGVWLLLLLIVCGYSHYKYDEINLDVVFPTLIISFLWPVVLPLIMLYGVFFVLVIKPIRRLPGSKASRDKGIVRRHGDPY